MPTEASQSTYGQVDGKFVVELLETLDLQPLNTDNLRSIANKDVRYVKAGITENAILILYLSASEKEIFTDIVSDTILHMNY